MTYKLYSTMQTGEKHRNISIYTFCITGVHPLFVSYFYTDACKYTLEVIRLEYTPEAERSFYIYFSYLLLFFLVRVYILLFLHAYVYTYYYGL